MPGRIPALSQEIITTGRWKRSASRPATMPITPGCQPRSASTRAASSTGSNCSLACLAAAKLDAPLEGLPRGVEAVDVLGKLLGPLGPVGHQQLDGQLRLAEPAGGIQPRGELEGHVLGREPHLAVGVSLGGDLGDGHQRGQAQGGRVGQALQPVVDQHAVLVHQRHDVGHGAQGGQPDGLEQEILHPRGDPLGPAGLLAEGPGQLQGHARAAQAAERIAAAGQPRMDDGRGVGQLRARLVVVGDDQLDAQLAGQGGLLDAGDAAIDGDDQLGPSAARLRIASAFSP